MKKTLFKLFTALLILTSTGCQEDSNYCPQQNPYFRCTYQNSTDESPDSVVVIIDGLVDQLMTTDEYTDGVSDTIYSGVFPPDPNVIKIPLRVDYSTVIFKYIFDDSLIDTCYLYYTSKLIFESPNCGFISEFKVDSFYYTTNVFDSSYYISPDINDKQENNFKIFY